MAIIFAGLLTAVGGGILRDVFVIQVPMVFVKELYVTASFIGIFVFYFILYFGGELYIATIVGIAIATGVRLTAMKFNWNLPKVRGNID